MDMKNNKSSPGFENYGKIMIFTELTSYFLTSILSDWTPADSRLMRVHQSN